VAFVVMLAGPGVPGSEIILDQTRLIMKAQGSSDEDVAKVTSVSAKGLRRDAGREGSEGARARVRQAFAASPESLSPR
jgi:hypothetical protein